MRVLVSGATGFIGSALIPSLLEAGHDVRAMTRRPRDYQGAGTPVEADTRDLGSLQHAMNGCDAAYYLVHGLNVKDNFAADADQAETFGKAAAAQGLTQIVYLGGLGRADDALSDHLASRQEVEVRLGHSGVPVTALRAALVIGQGSASYELLKQVVLRLPVLVVPPKAATTQVQPIGLRDIVRYLLGVLGLEAASGKVFEVGGTDVMTYEQMLHRVAVHLGGDSLGVPLPVLPGVVAKAAVTLLTDVDPQLAETLLESLGNDVIVTNDAITHLLPGPLQSFDEMLRATG